MTNESFLIKGSVIGAKEVVPRTEQAVVINLQNNDILNNNFTAGESDHLSNNKPYKVTFFVVIRYYVSRNATRNRFTQYFTVSA